MKNFRNFKNFLRKFEQNLVTRFKYKKILKNFEESSKIKNNSEKFCRESLNMILPVNKTICFY